MKVTVIRAADYWHGRPTRLWFVRGMTLLLLFGAVSCGSNPPGNRSEPASGSAKAPVSIADEPRDKAPIGLESASGSPPILFAAPTFQLTDQSGSSFGTDELVGKVWIA